MALSGALQHLLHMWLPSQRWYPSKGRGVSLTLVDVFEVDEVLEEEHVVTFRLYLLGLAAGDRFDTIQVPLSFSERLRPDMEGTFVGELADPGDPQRFVYDGAHDPGFIRALARLAFDGGQTGAMLGRPVTGVEVPDFATARIRVLAGEQSNTSVLIDDGELPVIMKLFRVLAPGRNPDVVITSALTEGGSDSVAHVRAWIEADWRVPATDQVRRGELAVVSEYIDDGVEGWSSAVEAVEGAIEGGDTGNYRETARGIGRAIAGLHRDLRVGFGAVPLDEAGTESIVDSLRERARWAMQEAGEVLAPFAEALAIRVERLEGVRPEWPLQRVHGDLHLGQMLHSGRRGWIILDFEGEPLRSLAERERPDLPLRDIAGIVRSIDYAANYVVLRESDPGRQAAMRETAADWTRTTTEAFLEGYGSVEAADPLLRAYRLDKALYEVVYELRNRPNWLDVPLRAVEELLAHDAERTAASARQAPDHITSATRPAAPPAEGSGPAPVPEEVLARVSAGAHHAPHAVLGPHPDPEGRLTIRVLKHLARGVGVVTESGTVPLSHEYNGIWAGTIAAPDGLVPDYRLDVDYGDGQALRVDDAYRFLPTLGELDLHLIGEGRHESLWSVLGAHERAFPGPLGTATGTSFAVWAPNARAVRIVGGFNEWNGTEHAMRSLGASGVWELFVPAIGAGAIYKYEILGADGVWRAKADPMAFGTEIPPATASVVTTSRFDFGDGDWMAARAERNPHDSPMSIYEVHLGSWRLGLDYRQLATELVDYVVQLGFTHVELMPVAEHPFGGSWGYQVTSYYAPTSRFGHPDEFRHLVDSLHRAGVGVILDWVPAHFPKDEWALARFDGAPLYEHPDPRRGEHPDWGTLVFDYGRREVRNFLVANALYWFSEFHVDGLRVDAVASMLYLNYSRPEGEWLPNVRGGQENLEAIAFLQEVNASVYRAHPGAVMIAEESTAFPDVTGPTDRNGLGFGLKWNMGWMHDSLDYMAADPLYRRHRHNQLTFSLVYAFSENFVLPISHDEVVHGKGSLLRKMPGDRPQQLANVRAYLAYQWAHPGKQLIFMGTEFGQEAEWSEQYGLDWWLTDDPRHSGVQRLVAALNSVYRDRPALWSQDGEPRGFQWLDGADADRNVLSFVRWSTAGEPLVCVVNFAGTGYENHRIPLPSAGPWAEVLNTDAEEYGGTGTGNLGRVEGVAGHHLGQPAFADLRLPALSAIYLAPEPPAAG